jgi:hypothetical protein
MFLATALMFGCGVLYATPGGEGSNTGCNGVGNPNSPCTGRPPSNPIGDEYTYGGTGVGVGVGLGVGIAAAQGGNATNLTSVGVSNQNTNLVSTSASASNAVQVGSASRSDAQGGSGYGGTSSAQAAGGAGGAGGVGGAGGQSSNSMVVNNVAPSKVTVRNTPDVYATIPSPTAPCIVTGGVAGSSPGLGLSFGGGIRDKVCSALEIRRVAGDNPEIQALADAYLINELKGMSEKPKSGHSAGGFWSNQ